ncbi:MAG: 30S ribosomal protein S3 [Nitrospinota bacterium]|nr:30S ribosomal protein S3 [Nitrospinota bacterium]HJN03449.1 30S ribosomal protein S3 [Nitrospinota bacterium]
MGQKVNPISFRIGITRSWLSLWYAKKDYAKLLHEDLGIRKFLKKKLYHAGVSKIEIERAAQKISINVFSARPGIIIGKRGYEIDRLKANLQKRVASKQLSLNIKEVRKTEINAQLVAENIALQLERRVAFRRAMKKSVTTALRFGAKGIRINCAGRLGGAEIARTEWYRQGRVPLHTLRADIDYGFAESRTTYGIIGVKAWIFHGEIIPEKKEPAANKLEANPES